MPVYTPTCPRVVATETTPPMFRPGNQANMEPAEPTNPCPSQSFMPGLGQVRSGNIPGGNGLDPIGEEQLDQWRREQIANKGKKQEQIRAQVRLLETELAKIQARRERSKTTGLPLPRYELRELDRKERTLRKRLGLLSQQVKKVQTGGQALPPWKRRAVYRQEPLRPFLPMQEVPSPATPNPLNYEPGGISLQRGQGKILAMQKNIQPVKPMSGLGFIPGVPTWALLAAGGGVAYMLLRKRRR